MIGPSIIPALRALRDCGVIRVRMGRVPRVYQELQRRGAITARAAVRGEAYAGAPIDLRLNETGKMLAEAYLKPVAP